MTSQLVHNPNATACVLSGICAARLDRKHSLLACQHCLRTTLRAARPGGVTLARGACARQRVPLGSLRAAACAWNVERIGRSDAWHPFGLPFEGLLGVQCARARPPLCSCIHCTPRDETSSFIYMLGR